MDPSVTLTKPWVDQPNTIRATTVSQMYSAQVSGSIVYTYDVGRPPVTIPTSLNIRNKATSHDLHVVIYLPLFMTSSMPTDFVLTAQKSASISLDFNEPVVKIMSSVRSGLYDIPLTLTVEPLLVNGPVSVEPDNVRIAFPSLI